MAANGDLWRMSHVFVVNGVPAATVMHVLLEDVAALVDDAGAADALETVWQNNMRPALLSAMSAEATYDCLVLQKVAALSGGVLIDDIGARFVYAYGLAGGEAGDCLPSQVAVNVKLRSTSGPQRKRFGKNAWPGIPESFVERDNLNSTGYTEWTNFADLLPDPANWLDSSSGAQFALAIRNSNPLAAQVVTTANAEARLRVIQNRTESLCV